MIHGNNSIDQWFHTYWNYSKDNVQFTLIDLGIIIPGVFLQIPDPYQTRYGSVIIELNTNDPFTSPGIGDITLFSNLG